MVSGYIYVVAVELIHGNGMVTTLYYNNSSSSIKQPNMASPPLLRIFGGRVYVNFWVSDVTNPESSSL